MCGIIGYTASDGGGDEWGRMEAIDVLMEGMRRLEYRGYDSAGVAVVDGGRLEVIKRAGHVEALEPLVRDMRGRTGVAHTRWATHGGVTDENAHPHMSCGGEVAIVHNGIVENYAELRAELEAGGHVFKSDTDSEVIAHLLEEELRIGGDGRGGREGVKPMEAVLHVARRLRGSYAFLAVGPALGDTILAARKDSPLAIGFLPSSKILASDVMGFIRWTDDAYFMENGSVAIVRPDGVEAALLDGSPLEVKPVKVAFEVAAEDEERRSHVHMTLGEILEQPRSVLRALSIDAQGLERAAEALRSGSRLFAVAAGTSYHATLVARHAFAELAEMDLQPVLASEHSVSSRWMGRGSSVVAVSQSGETADVLYAVRDAKARGATIVAVVNAPGSSLEREADITVNVRAGPEVGVAATKSFTAQLAALTSMAYAVAGRGGGLDRNRVGRLVEEALGSEGEVRKIAGEVGRSGDIYLVGRGMHYPMALEGALKVKELAYVHAEGLAAGELKHGTLALVEKGTPVVLINPRDDTYNDTLSNGEEMKARGAVIIGISDEPNALYDYHVRIPSAKGFELPIVEAIPLQLLAYHIALTRGAEIDRPRNLAKSVTVK